MSAQTKAKTQRYSAQIRASQYDPDVDIGHFAQQQQNSISNTPLDPPRPFVNYHDHYPISSSNNSAATTIINLTSHDNSSISIPEASGSSERLNNDSSLISSSLPRTKYDQTSFTPPSSGSSSTTPPPPSSHGSNSKSSNPINSKSNGSSQLNPQQESAQSRHQKNGSTASIRSRLIAKGARTSLQLNLRTNQQGPYPTSTASPGLSPGAGWDDSSLAPSPLYPTMDSAFVKGNQMKNSLNDLENLSGDKYVSRMSTMNNSSPNTRQEEGRIQLEKERSFQKARRLRVWTKSKVILLISNTLLLAYAIGWTIVMTMSWNGVPWTKQYLNSGIMMVANRNILYLMMIAAPLAIFIAVLGYIGIFVQSRRVLAFYTVLLWPLFGVITSIGYIAFRRNHVSLYQKLKFSWINEYTRNDRLIIQNSLSCCGYRSAGDYPSYDLHCFPRAPLPSCESLFLGYQQDLLSNTSAAAFSVLLIQLIIMLVALLCSNHIDHLYRSANPITPKLYTS